MVHPHSSADTYQIQVLQSQHRAEAVALLCESFFKQGREPITSQYAKLGIDGKAFNEFYVDLSILSNTQGSGPVSTVMVDTAQDGAVVGVCLVDDLLNPASEADAFWQQLIEETPVMEALLVFLEQLDQPLVEYLQERDQAKPGSVWHVWMCAVSSKHAQKGIARRFAQDAVSRARTEGYRYVVSEATNAYSWSSYEKLGFSEFTSKQYDEFCFPVGSDQRPFVPESGVCKEGFERTRLMWLKLV